MMKEFFNRLSNNPTYKRLLKEPWTYVAGAVMLSFFQILHLNLMGSGWGASGAFATWGGWVAQLFGANVETWSAFSSESAQNTLAKGFFADPASLRNLGIILGAMLAALLASQFKIKKIKSWRQVAAAAIGGLLMGYGARVAGGCNVGALFSGISSLSVAGWIFGLCLMVGAWVGGKLLVKYFMS